MTAKVYVLKVDKMLSGKNFPQNFRALRIVVEELLRDYIINCNNMEEMQNLLTTISSQTRTSKLWVNNLIRPVLYMMLYVRAEREGDWMLHIHAVTKMVPYFFAAGHPNYSRYGLYYLNDMKRLPNSILSKFLRGEHVTRHQRGYWNGIWSDMFIESTFMRYGKGPSGLIGITLKSNVMRKWAYSLNIFTQVQADLERMRESSIKQQIFHKEESAARKGSDQADKMKIQTKLSQMIHPLKPENHDDQLTNIASGYICQDQSVNVDNAVEIGKQMEEEFSTNLPEGFYSTIHRKVKTLPSDKKSVKVGDVEIFSTEAIYARVMCLLSIGSINLEEVLKHELSPVPSSIFSETGDIRSASGKSALKNSLQVEVPTRDSSTDAIIIDGCALLWTIQWPSKGSVSDLADAMYSYIKCKILHHDVLFLTDTK